MEDPEIPRILSIDGGGLKGVMPAAFLAAIEETYGVRIVDHFDIIAGTSTGGIIALGLGLGLTASEIHQFYIEHGPEIFGQTDNVRFPKLRSLMRTCRLFNRSKYDPEALKQALTDVFGNRKLGESKTRLVIPAYNRTKDEVHIYKTAHHRRFQSDYKEWAVDVAMATAAAPTFFPSHETDKATGLLDGGIWANNPSSVAALEGSAVMKWSTMDQARLLSLGCTTEINTINTDAGISEFGPKGKNFIAFMINAQGNASLSAAKLILGHPHTNSDGVTRIDADVPYGRVDMDDASQMKMLSSLGQSLARNNGPQIEKLFLFKQKTPFVPVHNMEKDNGNR